MGCAVGLLAACDDADPATTGSGSSSSASTGAGAPCGDVSCGANEYCGFEPGTCDGPKACHPFPPCMPESITCGCDKMDHQSACYADFESGGVLGEGSCEFLFNPEGTFLCTYQDQVPIHCKIGTEYCHVQATPSLYELSCLPVPAACPAEPTDCDCLMDYCSQNYCGVDPVDHTITVLCAGRTN